MGHEDYTRIQQVEGSSDRTFGLVFAAAFLLIGSWPLLHGSLPRWWALGVGAAFLLVALLRARWLAPLNRWWMKLGLLLSKIVSPIALGLLYYGVMVPIGLAMKLAGTDPLQLKRDSPAVSYWRPRAPPGPRPDSMTHPF